MRKLIMVIIPILLVAVVAAWAFFFKEQIPNKETLFVPNSQDTVVMSTNMYKPLEANHIQAWIYPGNPACAAMTEIADGRKIHVLKPEYFKVSQEGRVVLLTEENDGCNAFSPENLKKVKEYSQQQYITVASNHIDMRKLFASADNIEHAVKTLVDFTLTNNVHGIEIDFEEFSSWTSKDYANYKNFLTKLGNSLHAENKGLMIDTPPITSDIAQYYLFRYEDFNDMPVDYLVMMIYDYQYDHGSTNAVAPIPWVYASIDYALERYKYPQKVVVGVPSYGYMATAPFKFRLITAEQAQTFPGYSQAQEDKDSYEMMWENEGIFYSYVTSQGLKNKINAILSKYDIAGVSVWHLGGNNWVE